MKIASLRVSVVVALLIGLSACAQRYDQVILLPYTSGQKTAVVVSDGQSTQLLDSPFQVVRRSGGTLPMLKVFQSDENALRADLGPLARIAPSPPSKTILYFQAGGLELMPESIQNLEQVLDALKTRAGAEFFVVGHTDTVGSVEGNDRLSLERAKTIVKTLISKGVPENRVEAVGRGEREPLIPTADEVNEPRNRRVEILVY